MKYCGENGNGGPEEGLAIKRHRLRSEYLRVHNNRKQSNEDQAGFTLGGKEYRRFPERYLLPTFLGTPGIARPLVGGLE